MKTFKFYAKIKNCKMIFNEKMPPGCVAIREVTFKPYEDAIFKEDPNNIWLTKAIKEQMEEMMKSCFHVEFEEIK